MSKNSKNSSIIVPTIWKRVPRRIKGLLKGDNFDPTSPPPSLSLSPNFTKTKSSLIYRIFPTTNKNKKRKSSSKDTNFIQLKKSQWVNNSDFHVSEMDMCNEVPLRSNLMSFFTSSTNHQQQQQQNFGWSNLLSTATEKLDSVSRIYIGTLGKIRLLSHYTMEQQIAIHHILSCIQNNAVSSSKKSHNAARSGNAVFNSLLSGRISDSIMMNNRKPRRTRYIFMLLSTPASHVVNKIHPVTDALQKLRKPYAETITVITSEMILEEQRKEAEAEATAALLLKQQQQQNEKTTNNNVVAYKFVPADYLLDPATLRGRGPDEPQNRLGTKFDGSTNQKQQQQQKDTLFNNNKQKQQNNNDTSTITPIMAKIQIQTN